MKLPTWYVCVHLRELPTQALVSNADPGLREAPAVVLDGKPPLDFVCSLNRAAARLGVVIGMTRVEMESFSAVALLRRDREAEARAKANLLNCVAEFSPLAEWVYPDDPEAIYCSLAVDLAGTQLLFGSPAEVAGRIRDNVRKLGLRVQLGISRNFHTAAMLARSATGTSFARAGEEARSLATLPVTLLPMTAQQLEIFQTWGIQHLGELAVLPEKELISRLGQAGRKLWQLARGEAPHLFQPVEAPFLLEERLELDDPVEQMESLLFCLGPMLERVIASARDHALAIASLRITAQLDRVPEPWQRTLRPALPTCDRALLLKLVQLDMDSNPPQAGVCRLEVSAQAAPAARIQLGLFSPQLPEPGRLQVTLARIAAIVGERRVGWGRLEDTHREDQSSVEPFHIGEAARPQPSTPSCTAIRRLRPPASIAPRLQGRRPQWFLYGGKPYTVQRSFGPWQRSGTWWSGQMWSVEQWDVVAHSPAHDLLLCVLSNDRLRASWHLEAIYD